jgi:hypothetical protein
MNWMARQGREKSVLRGVMEERGREWGGLGEEERRWSLSERKGGRYFSFSTTWSRARSRTNGIEASVEPRRRVGEARGREGRRRRRDFIGEREGMEWRRVFEGFWFRLSVAVILGLD